MKQKGEKSKTLGIVAIVLGAISLIPLIGLFIGLAAIIVGIIDIKKTKSRLGVIGLLLGIIGILITLGLYGSLFYYGFIERGGTYDELRIQDVQEYSLPNTINAIEGYKARFEKYPDKIEDLQKVSEDYWLINDQIQVINEAFGEGTNPEKFYFHYENKGDYYYLFSKGIDGQPFTADDVFPILKEPTGKIGYRNPE